MAGSPFLGRQAGFSLPDVLVATALLAVGLISLAQLFAVATANNSRARTVTFTTVLARQKMEQLRSLAWGFDPLGVPLTDVSTDTASGVDAASGGTGLSPSPTYTLRHNTSGYVDYVDGFGNILGGGATPPIGTVYVRRWSVEPLAASPNDTLVLQVLATRLRDAGVIDESAAIRRYDDARLTSVKTRKTP